jgi:Ca-activated chloride channel family protein
VDVSHRVRALQDRAQDEKEVEVSRSVQGRAFRLEKGIWRDATIPSKATSVAIKYGSEAYFQLVRARPEWARYLALGKALSFRSGSNTVVTVGETGKEKLTAAELAALER